MIHTQRSEPGAERRGGVGSLKIDHFVSEWVRGTINPRIVEETVRLKHSRLPDRARQAGLRRRGARAEDRLGPLFAAFVAQVYVVELGRQGPNHEVIDLECPALPLGVASLRRGRFARGVWRLGWLAWRMDLGL